MDFIKQASISTKLVASTLFLVFLTGGLIAGVTVLNTQRTIAEDAQNKQAISLNAAAAIFERDLAGFSVSWTAEGDVGRLEMRAPIPEVFAAHSMIDAVGHVTGETATLFAFDEESGDFWRRTTNIIKPDGQRAVGTPLGTGGAVFPVLRAGQTYEGQATILGRDYFTIYAPVFDPAGDVIGILYVGVEQAAINNRLHSVIKDLLIGSAIVLAITAVLSFLFIRQLVRPIPELTSAVTNLAAGRLDEAVPHVSRGDEIGGLARAVGILKDASIERERLEKTSRDDQSRRAERQTAIESLIADFEAQTRAGFTEIENSMGSFSAIADGLRLVAETTASEASAASHASRDASGNVQTVAAATEELSSSVGEISRQLDDTGNTISTATDNVRDANSKVGILAEGARKIGDVVTLIADIADQTNMLALNATIEAARAGDAGKGFAVVASEVKDLAAQTSKATGEIEAQIKGIQSSTDDAVEAIRAIGSTMDTVNATMSAIGLSVAEQGAATNEISQSVVEAAKGTSEVAGNVDRVQQKAEEGKRSALEMNQTVSQVSSSTDRLKSGFRSFLDNVRAA